MIAHILGALAAGAAAGFAAGIAFDSRRRRAHAPADAPAAQVTPAAQDAQVTPAAQDAGSPQPATQLAEPAPSEPAGEVAAAGDAPDAAKGLQVADAVLDVADRLSSQELCRRLGEALRPLPGVNILMPPAGAGFDRTRHDWASTRPAAEGDTPGTVAATKVPGLARADGTVVRKARVVVFE